MPVPIQCYTSTSAKFRELETSIKATIVKNQDKQPYASINVILLSLAIAVQP